MDRFGSVVEIKGMDISVGIHPGVLDELLNSPGEDPRPQWLVSSKTAPYRPDGIIIVPGSTWRDRLNEKFAGGDAG